MNEFQWRPISTAPKDGSRILLARIADIKASEFLGTKSKKDHICWAVYGFWSDKWQNWNDGVEPCGLHDPTHWMRLPELANSHKDIEP